MTEAHTDLMQTRQVRSMRAAPARFARASLEGARRSAPDVARQADAMPVLRGIAPQTSIATTRGAVRAAELTCGDQLITRDSGLCPVRWIGTTPVAERLDLDAVVIPAGALAPGVPQRDLRLSPHHRVLMPAAPEPSAGCESLVSARHLLGREGVSRTQGQEVSYVSVLLDRHELILCDGAWVESFQPLGGALAGLGAAQRADLLARVPGVQGAQSARQYQAARPVRDLSDLIQLV